MRFTDKQKLQRKQTIRVRRRLDILDAWAPPTGPPAIIHHPRFFNPPISCRSGRHQWETGAIMGIPRMKCKKCGRIVMTGSFNGTETEKEIRTRNVPNDPIPTMQEVVDKYLERLTNDVRR